MKQRALGWRVAVGGCALTLILATCREDDGPFVRPGCDLGALCVLAGVPSGYGAADGTGDAARFGAPSGVAVDASGNVYVSDLSNHTIRKVTPGGVVTTFAGTAGHSGSGDGTGGDARFSRPSGLAVDASGNVYVADSENDTIRKITPAGAVTTLAGAPGQSGGADGTGAAARFSAPSALALDASGNLYVADSENGTIRKVTPGGEVTTLAGEAGHLGNIDGVGASARFDFPTGIAVDAAGTLYVADTSNDTIRKISPPYNEVTTLARAGAPLRFDGPGGLMLDASGTLYVAELRGNTLRKVTPDAEVITWAGTAGESGAADGTGPAAHFSSPRSLALDASGVAYVADSANHTIRKVTPAGAVTTLAGTPDQGGSADGSGAAARFLLPSGVAVDASGNVYVADSANHTLRKITPGGLVTTLAGKPGQSGSTDGTGASARFNGPTGVAMDASGTLYVADTGNSTIRKVTRGGAVTTLAGRFSNPTGVAADASGNVYVTESADDTIRSVTPAGVVTTLAGSGVTGSADGTGTAASFHRPSAVAVDASGNLFVADTGNSTIRKITRAGEVTTLAGSAGEPGNADGPGATARFSAPQGLAVNAAGDLFIADTGNNAIRKISSAGTVSTVVGSPLDSFRGNFPGVLPASVIRPRAIAVHPATGTGYAVLSDAVFVW